MAYDEQLDKITQRELCPAINDKIDTSYEHISDTTPHVSETDRTRWDEAADRPTATGSYDGLMSKADKIKLDNIEEYANNYIHPKSGVNVGTYLLTTVNEYGHVVGGSNPSSLDVSVTNANKLNNQDSDYYAPKVSPILLGVPQCPTTDTDANNTNIANTKWVCARLEKFYSEEIVLGVNFTGSCTVPTPSKSDDSTQIPNTAWVRDIIDAALADYRPVIIGLPYIWHSDTLPDDAFWCDGSSFSTTKYPELAKVYPSGKVPDYRGVVLRAKDRGKGYDSNRVLGSYQSDAMRNFTGTFRVSLRANNEASGVFTGVNYHGADWSSGNAASHQVVYTMDPSTQVPTADENRMKNIAVNYIVFATGFSILTEAAEELPTYTITVTQPTNGKIMVNGTVTTSVVYTEGDQVVVQAVANSGYTVANLIIDGKTQTNPYTFTVSKATSIGASITETSYTVTVSEVEGATVTLNGNQVSSLKVLNGDTVVINAKALSGYKIDAVYVNGTEVTVPYTATINKSSLYISVDTVANTHTVSVSQPDGGGYITINGATTTSHTVNDGDSITVNVSLFDGYELDFVNIDGVKYTSMPQTLTPTKDIIIYGQFKIKSTTDETTGTK